MLTCIEALLKIEDQTGAGSKLRIKELISRLDLDAVMLITAALDPYTVYGINKFPMPETFGSETDLEAFFQLLRDLSGRKVTGNAALSAATATLSLYDQVTAKYLAKVLKKDLKAGFSADTVNEVLGADTIPTYECKLAAKMDDKYKWEFPLFIDAKHDGQRCNTFNRDTALYLARSGKVMDFCEGLFDDILEGMARKILRKFPGETYMVFDGEVMAGNFTQTMNAKKSSDKHAKAALKYKIYDMVLGSEWDAQKGKLTQRERYAILDEIIVGSTKVVRAEYKEVHSEEEARAVYRQYVADGFEGAIVKLPNAVYTWNRNKDWTKMKPLATFDLTITAIHPGEVGSRLEGTMASISVEGHDENGNFIRTDVGSGFDDDTRKLFWDNRENMIETLVEIEADPNLSQSSGAPSGEFSLRWPIYKRIRALPGMLKD